MFKRMYLTLEENRLRDRFGGTVTTAIIEVLNKKTNDDGVIIRILFYSCGERCQRQRALNPMKPVL